MKQKEREHILQWSPPIRRMLRKADLPLAEMLQNIQAKFIVRDCNVERRFKLKNDVHEITILFNYLPMKGLL